METRKRKLNANVDKEENCFNEKNIPDYSGATSKKYKQQVKKIQVSEQPQYSITQMIMIDDELWCASATNCIYVLDLDCNKVRLSFLIIKSHRNIFLQHTSMSCL